VLQQVCTSLANAMGSYRPGRHAPMMRALHQCYHLRFVVGCSFDDSRGLIYSTRWQICHSAGHVQWGMEDG
jgi:hypothetical protein